MRKMRWLIGLVGSVVARKAQMHGMLRHLGVIRSLIVRWDIIRQRFGIRRQGGGGGLRRRGKRWEEVHGFIRGGIRVGLGTTAEDHTHG